MSTFERDVLGALLGGSTHKVVIEPGVRFDRVLSTFFSKAGIEISTRPCAFRSRAKGFNILRKAYEFVRSTLFGQRYPSAELVVPFCINIHLEWWSHDLPALVILASIYRCSTRIDPWTW